MIFVEDHWESYEEPALILHRCTTPPARRSCCSTGPSRTCSGSGSPRRCIDLVDRLGVRLTVGFNAIPMAVPHTRPTGVTAHATRRELIAGYEPWLQRVQVPGSAGNLLEYRLGQAGRDAMGFAVHVPHYLAQTEYPAAAERAARPRCPRPPACCCPTRRCAAAAEPVRAEIDEQVAQADEAAAVVQALEQQYDAFVRRPRRRQPAGRQTGPLPTADELGAELERFLAEQTRRGDQPEG